MSSAIHIVRKFFPSVKKVKDATESITIEVTKGDTKSATVKNHNSCAMAVACKRKFKLNGVIISRTKAYLVRGKEAIRYHLGDSVAREIVSFDRGAAFEPGEYTLSKVGEASRLGVSHRKDGSRPWQEARTPAKRHVTENVRTALGSSV